MGVASVKKITKSSVKLSAVHDVWCMRSSQYRNMIRQLETFFSYFNELMTDKIYSKQPNENGTNQLAKMLEMIQSTRIMAEVKVTFATASTTGMSR